MRCWKARSARPIRRMRSRTTSIGVVCSTAATRSPVSSHTSRESGRVVKIGMSPPRNARISAAISG